MTVDEVIAYATQFAYGVLEGMSFGGDATCKAGLTNVIYYGYETYTYRDFYIPANAANFALASQKFAESYNSIYA
jgi:hypothetical protein